MPEDIFEYMRRNSLPANPAPADSRSIITAEQQAAETERARHMLDTISRQLDNGDSPQNVLYTALTALGLFAHDAAWSAAVCAQLDAVYADLAQLSIMADNDRIEAERLQQLHREAMAAHRKRLEKMLTEQNRVTRSIQAALNVVQSAQEVQQDT